MSCIKKNTKVFLLLGISASIFISTQLILAFARTDTKFADSINRGISQSIRRLMANISSAVSFSVAELLLILLPIVIALMLTFFIARILRGGSITLPIALLLSALLLLLSLKSLTVSVGYYATPLSDIIGIGECEITEQRLIDSLDYCIRELNSLSEKVDYSVGGTSVGYNTEELSVILCDSYDAASEKYDLPAGFFARIKSVKNGKLMIALGISGIYTFYTGEANTASSLPDPEIAFCAAHELSHQYGVMREDEANFMAYLITTKSDDDYLRYSGYLSMYQYLASSLYHTDRAAYISLTGKLCQEAKNDIRASYDVIDKYSGGKMTDLSRAVNDTFLKGHGTEGVRSYGEVTRLAISYYYTMKIIN